MAIAILAAGALCAPVFGADLARPGTVNYIEGAAYLNGKALNNRNVGNLQMNAGDELSTASGRAEILLTPGVFLRVDANSAVKMISPDIVQTQIEIARGRAGVEVDQIFKANNLQIIDGGVTTSLVKTGYYEFNADQPQVKVFSGRAETQIGDGKYQAVKAHHEMALLEGQPSKPHGFKAQPENDDLFNWSKLRSQYLAEANRQIASEYAYAPGFNPGWYWDPYAWNYTYLGWSPFYSPFGWGWSYYPWGGWGGFYGLRFYGHSHFGHGYYSHPHSGGLHGGGGHFTGGHR